MANEIRERFRERKYSYKLKNKLEKEKNNKQEESYLKITLFSPVLFLGLIGKVTDRFKNNGNLNGNLFDKKEINSNRKNKYRTEIKEELKAKDTININLNTINKKEKSNSQLSQEIYSYVYNKKDNYMLEEKIYLKFKKKIIELKNECEIIESEEYLLTKYENDNDLYIKAKKLNEKIDELLKKLDKINTEYKLIKDKNLIEEPLLLDDSILIDDIINYRNKISKSEFNTLPNKIRLLNEYKYLYTKLDKLTEKTGEIKEISNKRVKDLSDRDKKFKEAKAKMVNLKEVEDNCNLIIEKNNKYLEELSQKVDKISEKKYVESKLKGMNGFLSATLRYIGLLSLTPLRGIIPGIGARTVATRKLIQEMIKNMHYEQKETITYTLNNYESEINSKVSDIDSIEQNIDYALEDINRLKKEFKDYFLDYNLEEYSKAYKKIELIAEETKRNKEKINIIREKLIKNKELNKETLEKVRKLNKRN